MSEKIDIALLTGGFALAGVTLSQVLAWFHAYLERRHQRAILLRTKYEEMTLLFLDSLRWSTDLTSCMSPEGILAISQSTNANKVHMLCNIYFPLLRETSGEYLDACTAFYQTVVRSYNPLSAVPLGQQVGSLPSYKEARDALLVARDAVKDQIAIHAKTYSSA